MLNRLILFFAHHKYILPIGVGTLALIKAVQEATKQNVHGDPYIFWAAGGKFMAAQALYEPIAGAQEFLYPPVAALLFQLLGMLPFPVAVGAFTFFNFMAWVALLWLTYRILRLYFPKASLQMAMLIGFIATIRYFWHNIVWVNVNALVALLSVGGLYSYLKYQRGLGLSLLTLATWIKVMPLLLIGILFVRRPKQTSAYVAGVSVLFAVIILGFRGVNQGLQDYADFWFIAFKPFLLDGKVYTDWIAFGLSATLSKLLLAHPDYNNVHYNIASWSSQTVETISLLLRLIVVGLTYYHVWKGRNVKQVPLHNLILTYLTILLVSGVAWEGHHLTLLLVIAGLYQQATERSMNKIRFWLVISSIGMGLLTSDLIGNHLAQYVQAFCVLTYYVIFLYVITLLMERRSATAASTLIAQEQHDSYGRSTKNDLR